MQLHFKFWPATRAANPGEKPRVVLLHGLGGTGEIWRPIAAALEEEVDLLAPDQRGHGKSRVLQEQPDYRPESFGADVIETLAHENFHPAWGVGHSMGVRTLLAAGIQNPGYFRGFVLIDLGLSGIAGGGLGGGLGHFIQKLPEKFPSAQLARDFMTAYCPDPAIGQYLMAVSKRDPDGSLEFPFDHQALVATICAASNVSVRPWVEQLAEMGKPVYLLRGAQSKVWSQTEFESEQAAFKGLSNVQFITFENAGHGLPFEQRAQFVAWLRSVID